MRLCLCLMVSSACSAASPGEIGQQQQAAIYNEDDRRDLWELDDPTWQAVGALSVAALIPRPNVLVSTDLGPVELRSRKLREVYGLCPGERFLEQPVAATCSGVLIDKDLLLTSSHCVAGDEGCAGQAIVFDYYYRAEGELERVQQSDVYACRRVVVQGARPTDYAILELDREVEGRRPVEVRRDALRDGDALWVVGAPSGLPLKLDYGAQVVRARAAELDYFELDSDSFEGASGSGVFDSRKRLVGVLGRGAIDYVATDAGCNIPNRILEDATAVAADPALGEEAAYLAVVLDEFCQEGEEGEGRQRLCDLGSCGDGRCTAGETTKCQADCCQDSCELDAGAEVVDRDADLQGPDDGTGRDPRAPGCNLAAPQPARQSTLMLAFAGFAAFATMTRGRCGGRVRKTVAAR